MILRIFKKDLPLRNLLFVLGEGILIYASVLIAASLRFGTDDASLLSGETLGKAALIMVVCQTCLYYNELYDLKVTDTYLELGLRLTRAIGIASILLALIYYFVPELMMGRGIFFVSLVFLVILVVPWRYAYKWVLKNRMFAERVMIMGHGKLCQEIINEIRNRQDSGYHIAGLVSSHSSSPVSISNDIPVFKMDASLCELATDLNAQRIVVAMDEKRGRLPTQALLRCKTEGIKILEGETLYEELTGKLFVEKLNPSWLIFSDGFRKPKVSRFLKRITGCLMASILLLLTLPLIALIAMAIKLDSKGPILYKQDRCGGEGRVFKVLKFRSMIEDAESTSGPCWATDDDWRITRVGKILRKYRLDEIPQIWNVLRGEMSFVGPRPERPEFVAKLSGMIPYYSQRHAVKPGITGWAQVSYRYGSSVEDALEKLKYDLFYVKNMSFIMDVMIMVKTAKIVLLRSGAR
jgi:sugar transferase (PEP-CTERM system associated)